VADQLALLAQAGPLALAPRYLGYMLGVLHGREAPRAVRAPLLGGRTISQTFVLDNVAVVPVSGPILQRADAFGMFGAVGVNDLRTTMRGLLADRGVEGILLVVDSPGGEVAGVADLADELAVARGKKPMIAAAAEGMFSAAYWLGSAVGLVTLPRTGSVGSIGVLAVHADLSQGLEQMGIRVTVVKSGAKKAQFSPFAPLEESARAAMQAEVDRLAGLFIGSVADVRGLEPPTVRGFEGGTFEGKAAVDAGLADAVTTTEGAFNLLQSQITSGTGRERMTAMDDDRKVPPPPPEMSELEQARTEGRAEAKAQIYDLQKVHEEAKKRAREDAAEGERKRNAEILRWCAFVGKSHLAEQFIASDLTIEGVRNELLQSAAAASVDIESTRTVGHARGHMTHEEIYARRREQIAQAARLRGERPIY